MARRLYLKQPLFAFNLVVEKYPSYTQDMLATDVAFKPKKRRSKYNPSRDNGKVSFLVYLRSQVTTFLNRDDKDKELSTSINMFYHMRENRNKPYVVPFLAQGEVIGYSVSKRYTRDQLIDLAKRVLATCDTHQEILACLKKDNERWLFGG